MDGLSLIEFSEDLNNAEAPEPLPPGVYPAEIISAEPRTSQVSGNVYLATQFRIPSDSYPADFADGDPDGVVLTYNRVLLEDSKRSRYRLRKFLEAVGGPMSRTFDPTSIVGCSANVKVDIEEYEGEKRAAIKMVLAA